MTDDEAMAELKRIQEDMEISLGGNRFPNWIGPQRFGSGRPVTPHVGRHVVNEDWEQAVMTYLSMEGTNEGKEAQVIRKRIREQGIDESILNELPRWMGFERRMIEHLLSNPDDHVGAFRKLPTNLQLMTVHALQSIVFNKSLQRRLEEGLPLARPVVGDIVGRVDEKSQLDVNSCVVVQERTLNRISRNCDLGRLMTTGPLPGSEISTSDGEPGRLEQATIDAEGLGALSWNVEAVPRLSSKGTRRGLVAEFKEFSVDTVPIADGSTLDKRWAEGPGENDRWHPEGACVRFRFTLGSGSYATVLLREFMKGPLANM